MDPLLVFLDTEFTDFVCCDLISIALVSVDGRHEFYGERTDYEDKWCSPFSREAVLPLLGKIAGAGCTREQLAVRLKKWFATVPTKVQIASDSVHDRDLLFDALDGSLPENVAPSIFNLRPIITEPIFNNAVVRYHQQADRPWHHALHDARAYRLGWLAWRAQYSLQYLAEGIAGASGTEEMDWGPDVGQERWFDE